jgi:hypothetical protein
MLFRLGEDSELGPILIRKMLSKGSKGSFAFKETLIEFCSMPLVQSRIRHWHREDGLS